MEISRAADASGGKLLVHKQWGVGYLKFNVNKHDKNVKINIKIYINKLKQIK